ncbi:MAG: MotA/TolQ/ExbB proton channel family protein [Cyanobacteriota bacterium]|nr:MotA/TolQ/ExbB proton channel family protein [Cyanobacteriota bacterium]
MVGSALGLQELVGVVLLLLSIAVLTLVFERLGWWRRWWRQRQRRQADWLAASAGSRRLLIDDWRWQMAAGEPLLQGAAVLAPLLGLTGTVFGLIRLLASLGPDLALPAGASLRGYGDVLLSTAYGLVVSVVASAALLLNQGLRDWQLGRLERAARQSHP